MMELFGYPIIVNNPYGYLTLISIIVLMILYFMKQKTFKKVIPSLIFLEKSKKRMNLASFFRKFVKDWIILLQLLILIFLCLAALNLSTIVELRKINKEVIFVIDASASSQAGNAFSQYKETARTRIGITNSIILAKNNPEIIAKQTNPINAIRIITTLRPSDSLSNIWDSMMIAGDIGNPKSTIVVISDFIDTNNKDIITAKNLLQAKGFNVILINPVDEIIDNTGIIQYYISGSDAFIDIKNYNSYRKEITFNDKEIILSPLEVQQVSVELKEGINELEIKTRDDFSVDNTVNIVVPETKESEVLYITNRKNSFVRSAFESIGSLNMDVAEPPIVPVGRQNLFVLDEIEYDALLPGTLDKIQTQVEQGSNLIIVAQENLDQDKLSSLLPVRNEDLLEQQIEILNSATLEDFSDYNFGLSSKYIKSILLRNDSIIIGEASDKENSPVILITKLGNGNILYYGILDEHNPFKLSSQYPLFWVNMVDLLLQKDSINDVNKKIGEVIYGSNIKTPSNSYNDFYLTEETGIYTVDNRKIAVNLLNPTESDINKKIYSNNNIGDAEETKVEQSVDLLPLLVIVAMTLLFFEIYVLKKRGTL